ncbi:hypothetical protein [Vibrio nigripulchritudo]|uniref:hypothetical protein n=1 Tax=Vibrio nigripulchritudo TaxID=28173 RepID=UPI002491EB5F|nr:hypothetical protein [Vibrio nigripulchritudo]BDU35745.1 hypothetical protein TUMSATVNIG2_02140 [Vibrio nigripulchritudo]BDU41415.1 hypothetical protein TUMSATVNIG3_02130 [Vibrio nigripulchritudo]
MHIAWEDYLVARKNGVKKFWKPLLDKNIAQFESLSGELLKLEIHELCTEYFDRRCSEIPIQHPKILEKVLSQWSREISLNNEVYLLWAYKAQGFNGVCKILDAEITHKPQLLLEKVLVLNPNNLEAKKLLLLHHLDTLDFALHELPHGLVLSESACNNSIECCEKLLDNNPEMAGTKTRFGLGFHYYKTIYFSWLEYQRKEIKADFFEWLDNKI